MNTAATLALDRARLAAAAQACEPDMVRFLRGLIAMCAESCRQGEVPLCA
jgi:hypothetical protein